MNIIEQEGNWNERKTKLKQKIAALTGNNLLIEEGREEEVLRILEIKLGKTKEQLNHIIAGL